MGLTELDSERELISFVLQGLHLAVFWLLYVSVSSQCDLQNLYFISVFVLCTT